MLRMFMGSEVYGPVTVCAWHEEWDALPISEQATYKCATRRLLRDTGRADGRRGSDPEAGA